MSAPVTNSQTPTIINPFFMGENDIPADPPLFSNSLGSEYKLELQEIEALKKQLEEKDKQILQNNQTIHTQTQIIGKITSENTRLQNKVAKEKEKNENLESQIADTESRFILLERQFQTQKQQQQIYSLPQVEPQNREERSFFRRAWEGFKNGVSSAGKFCRRHRRLFEAGFGIAGAVLAICFPQFAIPILLLTGAAVALFDWITSGFE